MSASPARMLTPGMDFAHAAVWFMGWVWLGEQGQRLGWSQAGGVLAVALWWALRIFLAPRVAAWPWPRQALRVLGVSTAVGVLFVGQAGHAGLLALVIPWALWSALLEARRPRWPTGGAAVLAALLVWAAVFHAPPALGSGASVALVLLAAALASPTTRQPPHSALAASALPHIAMGLMMGSLWLGSTWCSGAAGTSATSIGLHLLIMTALPCLWPAGALAAASHPMARPLLILAACTTLWMGDGALHGLTGMALIALTCALPLPRPRAAGPRPTTLAGPALLVAVGVWSPVLGPQALQHAYGVLAALALSALLHQVWRGRSVQPRRVSI